MFESKINRGRANGYAPLDGDGKVPLSKLPPIQSTIDTGSLVTQINSLSASISHISFSNTGSFATTGSNTFIGNQTIQGGVTASGFTIVDAGIPELYSSTDLNISANNINVSGTLFVSGNIYANNLTGSTFDTGSFATTGSNVFKGNQSISGSVNISSSLVVAASVVSNGSINALNSDLIIDGGDLIVSGGSYFSGSLNLSNGLMIDSRKYGPTGDITIGGDSTYIRIDDGGAPPALIIATDGGENEWYFGLDGNLTTPGDIVLSGSMYFGSGSSITENSSSIIITPAGAAAGQSLVVRQTGIANLYSDHPSGFYLGDTITLTFSPNNNYLVSGSAPYIFTGCTQEQLGTSLSGSLIYNDEYTKTLTWTIPALSDISGFTFEIYNFVFFVSQSISLSSSGSSEQSHIHLVSGDPSLVDIYLGDDDQYVKIEKNAGDVVIGTNLDTHHWRFDTSGSLIVPGNIIGAYNLATTGSNIFYGNQTIVSNVTFPSSSFISTTNASGGLFLSALNQGTLQLNADGGEGDVIIGRSGWDGKLIVNGNINLSGSLILSSSNIPTNLTGSLGDINGTIKIDNNSIYYCSGSFVTETYQIIVNQSIPYSTHVSIPKNQPGVPNLYSNGFSITTSGNTTYVLTGVYSDGDNWDCEIDNLNSNYLGGTQTMTLTWLDYEPINIWTKTDFGFERGKFATTGSNIFYGDQTITGSVIANTIIGSLLATNGIISSSNQITALGFVAGGGPSLGNFSFSGDTLSNNSSDASTLQVGDNYWIFGSSGQLTFPDSSIQTTAFIPTTYATTGSNTFYGKQTISGSVNIKNPIISIGDNFEGGKVAYILQSGDIGYDKNYVKGIIAAESDETQLLNWANANTACNTKTTNGYTDWVLPGLNELNILYTNKVAIGGFTNNDYWSSLESQSGLVAWFQTFSNGSQDQGAENYQTYVRAIRFFSISKETALNVDGDIILSGSLIQQVNYAPFASSSHSGATTLDITKDIHLLDVTGIETDNHWILPDGLYDGQVVKFALKGDGTANPNGIYIWLNHLRSTLGITRYNYSWSPFWDDSGGSARSLATAVYVDGAWNIDNGFYNLD